MSGNPGFFTLNQGNQGAAGGRPAPPPGVIPVPPAAPRPPAGAQRPPMQPLADPRGRMQPQGMPGPGMQRNMMPPPPPREVVPQHLLPPRPQEIVDIRMEMMSGSQARDVLSDYYVFRFEKVMDQERYDSEGNLLKPDWQQVRRSQEQDPKIEVVRQIARLNRQHTLAEKKQELNPDQIHQIERVLEQLRARQRDPAFEIKLVQIDDRVIRVLDSSSQAQRYKDEKKHKNKKSKHKPSKSHERKGRLQRVAITAYYRLAPRPDQDALAILANRQREQRLAMQEVEEQRRFQQRVQREQNERALREQQQQQQQQQQQRAQAFPPQIHPFPHPHPGQLPPGFRPGAQDFPNNRRGPGQQHPNQQRPPAIVYTHHTSDSGSDSSGSDGEVFSADETETTGVTRSTTSDRRGSRYRKKSRYIEELKPRHFGKDHRKPVYRQHSTGSKYPGSSKYHGKGDYIIETSSSLRSPRPSSGYSPSVVESIKLNAYAAGKADGKTEGRLDSVRLESELLREELAEQRRRARDAPPARIFQSPVLSAERVLRTTMEELRLDEEPRSALRREVPRSFDALHEEDLLRELPLRRSSYNSPLGPETRRPYGPLRGTEAHRPYDSPRIVEVRPSYDTARESELRRSYSSPTRGTEARRPWEAQHREASRYMENRGSPSETFDNPFSPRSPRSGFQYRTPYSR